MAKYEESFKIECVKKLWDLNRYGFLNNERTGDKITNVRDLVKALGISSYSLYGWEEKYGKLIMTQKEERVSKTPVLHKLETELEQIITENKLNGDLEQKKSSVAGIRFLSWLASELNIPNYGNMRQKQLMVAIGNSYIKRSGLIPSKAVEGLRI